MGRHAFSDLPSQARFLARAHPEITREGAFGLAEGWDVAFALWRADGGFDARYPADPHGTLSVVLEGAEVVRMDGRHRGRRGGPDRDGFILYPGGLDRRYLARGPVRICQMYLPPSLMRAAADGDRFDRMPRFELRDDRIFARDRELRIMTDQYLRRALDPVAPPSLLEMDTRALLIVLRLAEAHSDRASLPAPERGALGPERLRRAVDYMEAHLGEAVTLEALARVVGLSRHHFATAFRRATGSAPHRFLAARRIERAKALIRAGRPLAEVALDCGFASQQHFAAAFRRATGVPPAAWRAAQRE